MNLFKQHQHTWGMPVRAYAEPRPDLTSLPANNTIPLAAALGLTTIIWECTTCLELKTKEIVGKIVSEVENELPPILDQIEMTGQAQTIDRGYAKYIIGKVPETNFLPVK